ncbi:MAG: hypothetical protein R2865_01790 [Deinococcales bacterium]
MKPKHVLIRAAAQGLSYSIDPKDIAQMVLLISDVGAKISGQG